jgi:phage protein D
MSIRKPSIQISANGAPISGVISAEIHSSGTLQADQYRIECALSGMGVAWWDTQQAAELDVQFSLDNGISSTSLIVGTIDRLIVNPMAGTVTATGRDLSSTLIDAPLNENFLNQTSSDIATTLANRHGLTPIADATQPLSGRYYQTDHNQLGLGRHSHARTEWDLLAELARQEGFDLYVSQRNLYFQAPSSPTPFIVAWDGLRSNVTGLQLHVLPALSKGVQVQVQCWHSKQGQGFTSKSGPEGGAVSTVLRPNLTEDAAQSLADKLQADLAGQARQIEIQMPGELSLDPRSVIQLSGDLAGWAGNYRIQEIVRRIDAIQGFTQTVAARSQQTN